MTTVTGFDHVTLVVNDFARAVASYTTLLGTPPTFHGGHPELGTQAALFGVKNALIELSGPAPGASEAEGLRAFLAERGEGLQALAFATEDAAALSQQLRALGVRATPATDGTAHATDGKIRTFRTVELSPRAARGLSVLAVERSDTTRLRGPAVNEGSCVEALDHVVIRSADADAAIALYGTAMGIRLALDREIAGTRMLFFRTGGVTIEVVIDPTFTTSDRLWGVAYRVRDIHAANRRLVAAGISCSEVRSGTKPGTKVFTVRDGTCGVPTLIVLDPSRL